MKTKYEALNGDLFTSKRMCLRLDKFLKEGGKVYTAGNLGSAEDTELYAYYRFNGKTGKQARALVRKRPMGDYA